MGDRKSDGLFDKVWQIYMAGDDKNPIDRGFVVVVVVLFFLNMEMHRSIG